MRQRGQAPNSGSLSQRRASVASWEISSQSPERSFIRQTSSEDDHDSQHSRSASALDFGINYPHPWERTATHGELRPPQESPPLHNFHTLYRTSHHVPDNRYQQYLLGQTSRRKQTRMINRTCCATSCAAFSAVGCIFLFFIGLLIDYQPLYIQGVLIKEANATQHSVKKLIPGPDSERLPTARVAYQASFAYFVTIILCYCAIHPEWTRERIQLLRLLFTDPRQFCTRIRTEWNRKHYEDIPDIDSASTIPQFHQSRGETPVYRPPCWNRCTIAFTNWLYARGWYTPARTRRPQDDRHARTV